MKVYGYTDDKDVVQVDLSIDEIVDAELDPWRLDLFDPAPVSIDFAAQRLNFRKLGDVCFSYPDYGSCGSRNYLGLHDGSEARCFSVDKHNGSKLSTSDRSFAWHLREYLQYLQPLEKADPRREEIYDSPFCPRPVAAALLCGSTLVIDQEVKTLNEDMKWPGFIGEMFTEMCLPAKLPDDLNCAFELFAAGRPIVFGMALRNALAGRSLVTGASIKGTNASAPQLLPQIQVMVDTCSVGALREQYRSSRCSTDYPVWLEIGGCHYVITGKNEWKSAPEVFESLPGFYTADCVYSLTANEVRGTRIALFDVARRQARKAFKDRAVASSVFRNGWTDFPNADQLTREGFKILKVSRHQHRK